MMRKLLKRFFSFFLVPLTRWYLRKERQYCYLGVTVNVFPGVFHPGFFYSSKFLADFLQKQSVQNKSLLELGCGTGLISILCARRGAHVTASDINPTAVENAKLNAENNNVSLTLLKSDVFDQIEQQVFDWIIINPPYYAKAIKSNDELAWHCGENFEYFQKLFGSLSHFIHPDSNVVMVLTLGSGLDKIFEIARRNGFQFELLEERNVLFDGKDFLYRIKKISN
jgi:release factor glutamine methyltransferase